MNLLVSAAALCLASLAFLAYDQITFRGDLVRTVSAQAQIIGDTSVSAVTFNDPDVARRTLAALQNSSNVLAAVIVTPNGRAFASFARDPRDVISHFPAMHPRYVEQNWTSGSRILLARRMELQGKTIATIYILVDAGELFTRLGRYLIIAFFVLIGSLLLAYAVSGSFRRRLAAPLEHLALLARKVSREKNFALRADEPATSRELRVLIAAFNDMLGEIQARDSALQEMAAQSQATLQSIPQLVWTTDAAGHVLFLNQRWYDYTGMTANDDLNVGMRFIHSADVVAMTDAWNLSLRTGKELRMEARLRRKDGVYRWHLFQAVPIRNEAGDIQQWFGSSTDIHDRKLAESALIQAEKLAVTGRMAATIAHEINNPLASITNAAHLIGLVGPVNDQQTELLSLLSEETARVGHIVKSTLGLSRQTTSTAATSVPELIESILTLFERRFHSRNVQITKRYEAPDIVYIVPSELRQVFSNLFSNALDVMPTGGRLLIAVRHSFDWADPARRGLRVTVSDSGPGIPHEVRNRIFEAFFSTKAEMGTGLGLWVSRGIVEKYGGSIRVRSVTQGPLRGTCFSVFLPQGVAQQTSSQVA